VPDGPLLTPGHQRLEELEHRGCTGREPCGGGAEVCWSIAAAAAKHRLEAVEHEQGDRLKMGENYKKGKKRFFLKKCQKIRIFCRKIKKIE
jgi:hypothetical protein